jgi:hypothetical protein
MKAAIITTITGFLACAVIAAPVPQWVPSQPGGFSVNSPIGGVSIGPGGFIANGLLGGASIGGPPPPPPPQPRYQQGGYYRGWNIDTSANAAVEGETAQP